MSPTIIIGLILGATIGYILGYLMAYDDNERTRGGIIGAIFGTIIGFIISGLTWIYIGDNANMLIGYDDKVEITYLENPTDTLNQTYYVGLISDPKGNNMSYFVYEKTDSTGNSVMKIFNSKVILIEDIKKDESPYYIDRYEYTDPDYKWKKWGLREEYSHITYEIHIPKRSVHPEVYEIDLINK